MAAAPDGTAEFAPPAEATESSVPEEAKLSSGREPEEDKKDFCPEPEKPASHQGKAFRQKPSVGTWLQVLIVEDSSRVDKAGSTASTLEFLKSQAAPWQADFAVFDGNASPSQEVITRKVPSAIAATASTGSMFNAFRIAPPPSPAGLSVYSASPVGEVVFTGEDALKIVSAEEEERRASAEALRLELLKSGTVEEEDEDDALFGNNTASGPVRDLAVTAKVHVINDGLDSASEDEDGSKAAAHRLSTQMRTAMVARAEAPSQGAPSPTGLKSPPRSPTLSPAKPPTTAVASKSPPKTHKPSPHKSVPQENNLADAEPTTPSAPRRTSGRPPQPTPKPGEGAPAPEPEDPPQSPRSSLPKGSSESPASPVLKVPFSTPAQQSPDPGELASMTEIDSMVGNCLDKFFGDDKIWKRVDDEIATNARAIEAPQLQDDSDLRHYKVEVPKPYPGVQYRRSKNLDDKYPRFAENGATVTGKVEDHGQWLRVSAHIFLPMRVGTVQILYPLPGQPVERVAEKLAEGEKTSRSWWLSCCLASDVANSAESEVVVGQDGAEGASARSPNQCRNARGGQSPGAEDVNATSGYQPVQQTPSQPPTQSSPAAVASPLGADDMGNDNEEGQTPPLPRPLSLPEAVSRNPLSNVDAANRHFAHPINPFSDHDSGQRAKTPVRSASAHSKERKKPDDVAKLDLAKDVFQA